MSSLFDVVFEVAAPQHGLFTLVQAAEVGVDRVQVRRMASRDLVEWRSHGVYRINNVPYNERSEFMEAVLWTKGRGVIAGESALVLWKLADVNPRYIHLALPPKYRPTRRGGELYRLHHVRLTPDEIDQLDGIPVVTPAVAIRQAIAADTPADLIEQAVRRGQARKHFDNQTAARLLRPSTPGPPPAREPRTRPVGLQVDLDDLVGTSEIASRLGLPGIGSVHYLVRRYPEFPRPVTVLGITHVWQWSEVEAWAQQTGRA